MHTKTAQTVLQPLAHAVSALIIIISDAEISQTPTPDLSKLSKAVDAQIRNLVAVANKIVDSSADSAIKDAMPPACNQVLTASALLISSTSELLLNPFSSNGRQDLLEAVKGILDGTTKIIDVFDDSEILKIVGASAKIRNLLSDLEVIDRSPAGNPSYLHTIKLIHQTTVSVLQLGTKRIKDILSDKLITSLQDAIDCASKEVPFFIASTKLVLTWPDSVEAFDTQKVSRTRFTNELLRIERAVSSKGEEEASVPPVRESVAPPYDAYTHFCNILTRAPFSVLWKESAPDTRGNVGSFIAAAKDKITLKNDIMDLLTSSRVVTFPAKVLDQATPFFSAFNDLVEDATLGLNEAQCDQDSKELINAIDSCVTALDTNQALGIISELIGLLGDTSDTLNTKTTVGLLNDAVNKANVSLVESSTTSFDKKSKVLYKLVDHVLNKMPKSHPDYAPIATFQQRAENSIPAVLSGSKLYQKHPEEDVGLYLQNSLLTYADAAKGIQKRLVSYEGAFKTDELILAAHNLFDDNAGAFVKHLASKDSASAAHAASLAANAATQVLSIAEREKDNTEDAAYKSDLEKELLLIRAAVPQVITKADDLLANIGHGSDKEVGEMNKIVTALSNSLSAIIKVVQNYKGTTHVAIGAPTVTLWQPPVPVVPEVVAVVEVDAKIEASGDVANGVAETEPKTVTDGVVDTEPKTVTDGVVETEPKTVTYGAVETRAVTDEVADTKPKTEEEGLLVGRLSEEDKARLIAAAEEEQDDQLKGLTSAIKDIVIVMEEAPHLLSETEAEADPMKAAGQELKVEASHWDAGENMIVSRVNKIGDLFLLLSAYHTELAHKNNPQSKKAFIETAQEIVLETGKLVNAVEPLIKACSDKRLAIQMTQSTTRTSTLAQTLKIVAAVKVSSPRDTDKGVQLISNAQNLMQSVKYILRDAISCSLRLKKDVPSDLVHFKKVVYAKGYAYKPIAKAYQI